MARALPLDEDRATERRAIDFSNQEAVTCGLRDTVGTLRPRVADSPYGFALVLGDDGVLLGRLRKAALGGDQEALAEEVMEPGPSTNRPDASLAKLLAKLQERELTTAILTDPEGRLLGVVRRADLEAAG
jgi:CBS-domain-containing membrane protein